MPNLNAIKGIHSLKSVQGIRKTNSSDTDLLKLYMLEKERTRLLNDKVKAESKLEHILNRVKEIDEYFASTMKMKISPARKSSKRVKTLKAEEGT